MKITALALSITMGLVLPSMADVDKDLRTIYADRDFIRFDKNNDEMIAKEEINRFGKSLLYLDDNKDGAISYSEYVEHQKIPYLQTLGEKKLNVLYKKTEEENLYLDLYYPENRGEKPLPIVFYTHGGGWGAGNKQGAAKATHKELFTKVLEAGICVASVNYRLVVPDRGTFVPECVADCKDAMRYIAKHAEELGVDAQQFMTIGNSAGGHLSLMNSLTPPNQQLGDPSLATENYKVIGGIAWYGWTNLTIEELFIKKDKVREYPLRGTTSRVVSNKLPEKDQKATIHEMSPDTWLSNDSPPLLLIHGDEDTTINYTHALHLEELAKEKQANVKAVIVMGASHGFGKQGTKPSKEEVLEMTTQFFIDRVKKASEQ